MLQKVLVFYKQFLFTECIADFLFLVQHRDKFVYAETEDVLYRSAVFKKDFSGYKAATGWNALQIYAANLLTQPWRKEYRQIKVRLDRSLKIVGV